MKKEKVQKFLFVVFLSTFSGILLSLSFPKFDLSLLAWLSLIPFFVALEDTSCRKGFFLGWITGVIHFLCLLFWVTESMINYGGLSEVTSFFLLVVLSFYLGLYIGVFGGLLSFVRARYFYEPVIIAPVVWVLLEYLRAHLFSGFPWGLLGYSQYLNLPLIQISDITGVYGVSFLIVFVNTTLYLIIKWIRFRTTPFPFRYTLVTFIFFLTVISYGIFLIEDINSESKNTRHLRVALIQGNIDQAQKWDPSYVNETFSLYQSLTLKAAQGKVDLFVWPETAVPCYFFPEYEHGPFFQSLAKKINAPILFGSLAYELDNKGGEHYRYFNSAFLASPVDKKFERYDKVHLVPFGEYVPLKFLLPFVEKMVAGMGEFSSGKRSPLFLTMSRSRFGVLICYEIIFPELSRRYCKAGANFLVTITNDAWFGRSSAPYQHFSMAVFRSIENRIPVVRAANSGISGIIEPTGYIQGQTRLFEQTFLLGNISVKRQSTFYSRFGDIGVAFCGIGLLFFMYFSLTLSKKHS